MKDSSSRYFPDKTSFINYMNDSNQVNFIKTSCCVGFNINSSFVNSSQLSGFQGKVLEITSIMKWSVLLLDLHLSEGFPQIDLRTFLEEKLEGFRLCV